MGILLCGVNTEGAAFVLSVILLMSRTALSRWRYREYANIIVKLQKFATRNSDYKSYDSHENYIAMKRVLPWL